MCSEKVDDDDNKKAIEKSGMKWYWGQPTI
jgi:hypothetical protein